MSTVTAEYTKQIDCPDHAGQHTATLYTYPHRFAGIWECPETGASDNCEHETTHMEYEESPDGRHGKIEICDTCEIEIIGSL